MAEVEGISHTTNTESNSKKRKLDNADCKSSKIPKHVSKIFEPIGLTYIGGYEFQIDEEGYVIVYTDGSCIGNGKSNACAGYGVYFADNHPL